MLRKIFINIISLHFWYKIKKIIMDRSNKLNYLKISTLKFLKNEGFNCPNCGNSKNKIIKKKIFCNNFKRMSKMFSII